MAVTVRLFAAAAAAAGAESLTTQAGTLAQVLAEVAEQSPQPQRCLTVLRGCSVLVDEVVVTQTSSLVSDGSSVEVLPPFAGG